MVARRSRVVQTWLTCGNGSRWARTGDVTPGRGTDDRHDRRGDDERRNRAVVNGGETWWAESPNDKRPHCLVITGQAAIPALNTKIAFPGTCQMRGIPTDVAFDQAQARDQAQADGMPEPCALSFDSLTMLPKARPAKRICRLRPELVHPDCRDLTIATGYGNEWPDRGGDGHGPDGCVAMTAPQFGRR